jgi:hypothetical protein
MKNQSFALITKLACAFPHVLAIFSETCPQSKTHQSTNVTSPGALNAKRKAHQSFAEIPNEWPTIVHQFGVIPVL